MKIALIAAPYVPVPPVKYGGTEQVIHHIIRGLKDAGHEPILVGPADSKVDCQIVPTVKKSIGFAQKKSDLARYKIVEKLAIEKTYIAVKSIAKDVDVLHSNGVDLKRFARYPNLTTLHNMILLEDIPFLLKRKSLNFACISENQKLSFGGINVLGVAYNGLDPEEFPIVKKAEKYVCFVGRFDRDKNPHLAIELALSLNIKIKLAGKIDHSGDGYFQEMIEPHLDNPLVEYLGELDFNDKIKVLSKASCNLHPTNFREPFGLTVLEAAYCGTPTLATSRGSMPELIEDGKTGILVEDFVEGYEAISKCFEMDREYIAKRSRSMFNYNRMANDYLKLYEKAIKVARPSKFTRLKKVQKKLLTTLSK